ncbi:MAG: hypothetical protein JXN61_18110 [Sedimentisphaerales bacterium]|nr:hypothetical protein [Sedimentisphaerales bacterium]
MDKDIKITPEQLAKATDADYQKLVQFVSGAVNGAPDGAAIKARREREETARLAQEWLCAAAEAEKTGDLGAAVAWSRMAGLTTQFSRARRCHGAQTVVRAIVMGYFSSSSSGRWPSKAPNGIRSA